MFKNILITFLLFTSLLNAQEPESGYQEAVFRSHSIGIGIGQALLFGKHSDLGEDAIAYDLYYGYQASYTFQFLVNMHLNEFKTKTSSIKETSINTSIKAKLFDFDSFSPFWSLGLGFYLPKVRYLENGVKQSPKTKSAFGINASIGADLRLNDRFSIGFISHYHFPFKKRLENGYEISGSYLKLLVLPTFSF